MIPTPAKRRNQQQNYPMHATGGQEDEEDDLSTDKVTLFNTLMMSQRSEHERAANEDEMLALEQEQECFEEDEMLDDEELDYLRLDTIVEEDEISSLCSDDANHNSKQAEATGKISRDDCDNSADFTTALSALDRRRRQFHLSPGSTIARLSHIDKAASESCETHDDDVGEQLNLVRPQTARGDEVKTTSDNKSDNNLEPPAKQRNDSRGQAPVAAKMEVSSKTVASSQSLPLPSTNRLISEHQARQKQALFRCLAERQKMLDESGQRPLDLMSAASLKSLKQQQSASSVRSSSGSVKSASSRTRKAAVPSSGVPLSAVDLNSISDVQIDELLGRLASASSSSLSSNSESLDSSDLSNVNSEDDDDASTSRSSSSASGLGDESAASARLSSSGDESPGGEPRTKGRRRRSRRRNQVLASADAPNVIGVHEDAPSASAGGRLSQQVNCRDSHRLARPGNRSTDHDDEDDDDHHHELLTVRPSGASATAGASTSLSPLPSSAHKYPSFQRMQQEAEDSLERSSKLQQYFTSGLVNPHEFEDSAKSVHGDCKTAPPSVEEVLARMLKVLNEIRPDEQERVTELIERDFVQLEHLLNYSLAPTNNVQKDPANRSQAAANNNNLAQKLISCQQQLATGNPLMSKDSDYGSDTQSADCFSQCNEALLGANTNNKWLARHQPSDQVNSDSPSPTSLATTTSSSGSTSNQPPNLKAAQQPTLSPLAIELSFKLAESLQRLAQQRRGSMHQTIATDTLLQESTDDDDEPGTVRLVGADASDEECGPSGRSSANDLVIAPPAADGADQSPTKAKRSPMKSIVLINANRPPSTASIVSATSNSTANCEPAPRNLTPVNGTMIGAGDEDDGTADKVELSGKPLRQPFKTRVNINSSSSSSQFNPVVLVSGSALDETSVGAEEERKKLKVPASDKRQDSSDAKKEAADLSEEQVTVKLNLPVQQQHQQPREKNQEGQTQSAKSATLNQSQDEAATSGSSNNHNVAKLQPIAGSNFVRRRSARSSLRRRPSFTGSIGSLGNDQPRQPRPGSPLPRPLLAQVAAGNELQLETMQGRELAGQAPAPANQQHQLQRALILAQKYNYSPAKLAASKLSQKLLIANNSASSSGISTFNGSQTLNQQQKLTTDGSSSGKHRSSIAVTGQVQLDISYVAKSGSLTVHVMRCAQLAPVSKRRTTSNPYVKLYLLPDRSKSGKRKSSIQRSDLNPEFNESFTFGPLQLADFDRRLLWLSVWHKDRLGRNEFLGELRLPLSHVRSQLLSSDSSQSTTPKWYQLGDRVSRVLFLYQSVHNNTRLTLDLQQHHDTSTGRKAVPGQQGERLSRSETLGIRDNGNEQQVTDKLGELQQKAARLTSAMASPPSGGYSVQMNCTLGPPAPGLDAAPAAASSSSASITGKLFVALKFVPENHDLGQVGARAQQSMVGELQVMVKEARNVAGFDMGPLHHQPSKSEAPAGAPARAPPAGALPNPYCKCYLLSSNGQRLAKQKTPTLKRTANPRWDHKCVFPALKLGQLAGQAIEIHMFNRDQSILVSSSSNEYLGAVRLCKGSAQQSDSSIALDSESIASDQSTSELSDRLSRQNSGASQTTAPRRSITTLDHRQQQQQLNEPEGALCTERESRLWTQVLQRPGIWVYGELRLRPLRPLVSKDSDAKKQVTLGSNIALSQQTIMGGTSYKAEGAVC